MMNIYIVCWLNFVLRFGNGFLSSTCAILLTWSHILKSVGRLSSLTYTFKYVKFILSHFFYYPFFHNFFLKELITHYLFFTDDHVNNSYNICINQE